eukprot:gene30992-39904_t
MERFTHICRSCDPYLDVAVAKALYCISCAPENIEKLAEQNVLSIVYMIWSAPYEKTPELLLHLVACLYNLTTSSAVQGRLVSQGITRALSDMWPMARDNPVTCRLVCMAVAHLGCGAVNSAQMVAEGCTPILCVVANRGPKWASYGFPPDLSERCAAALRNLLCVASNQDAMVADGVIRALVELASTERLVTSGTEPSKAVRQNCAAALRSMTFNDHMRQELLESGAISIILDELTLRTDDDDINIGPSLLTELEAESWSNGSRGRQKEGRSPPIEPAPLFQDLLGGTPNVVLDVATSHASLQKFLVRVHLEEPPIEADATLKGLEQHGLKSLLSIDDLEDSRTATDSAEDKK